MDKKAFQDLVDKDRINESNKKNKDKSINELSSVISTFNKHQAELLREWNKRPGATESVKKAMIKVKETMDKFFMIIGE